MNYLQVGEMICLLGGSGYIGSRIKSSLEEARLRYLTLSREEVDYYQRDLLIQRLRESRADFLINAGGFTGRPNVDACERFKAETLRGNAVLPGVVREACEDVGIPFGHVSSGCIYSGSKEDGTGFSEEDPPNFTFRSGRCSFYSGSKALGEEVLAGCESCYVWRLRMPFDQHDGPRNYLSKLLRYERLLDARNSLTHLGEFAEACVKCIRHQLPFGTYNLTNGGSLTTREIAELLRTQIAPQRQFQFFQDEAEFMRSVAVAPRSNCMLDNRKALEAGLRLSPVREALMNAMRNWKPAGSAHAML